MGRFRNTRGANRGNRGNRGGNRINTAEGGNLKNFNQRRRNRGGSFNQQDNVIFFIFI